MDIPESPGDNTSVIKMVQGLNRFLKKSPVTTRGERVNFNLFGRSTSSADDSLQHNFHLDSSKKHGSFGELDQSKKRSSFGALDQSKNRSSFGLLDHSSSKRASFTGMFDENPARKRQSALSIDEKAELIASKSKAAKLEVQLESIEFKNKRSDIEDESKRRLQANKFAKDQEEIDVLRRKYKELVTAKQTAVDELAALEQTHSEMKKQLNSEIEQKKSETLHFKNCLEKIECGKDSEFSQMKESHERMSIEFNRCRKDLEESETMVDMYRIRVEESKGIVSEFSDMQSRCLLAEGKVKELEQKLTQGEENNIVVQKSQSQLAKYRDLERENQTLREDNRLYRDSASNSSILQEKINSLNSKLSKMNALKENVEQLEYENEALLKKLKTWEAPDPSGSDAKPRSPLEMTRIIADLQASHLNISGNNAQLEARAARSSVLLKSKDDECVQYIKQSREAVMQNELLEDKNQKLQRRLTLVTTERDGLRHVLSSYENEEGTANNIHMQQSEEKVAQYSQQIKVLEDNLETEKVEAVSQRTKYLQLVKEVKMLKASQDNSPANIKAVIENERMKKELDDIMMKYKKVNEEKEVLELRIEKKEMQGDYDPLQTRVLSMTNNPMKTAHEEYRKKLKNIEEENCKMRKKIIQLQTIRNEEAEESMNVSKLIKSSKPMEEASSQIAEWKEKYKHLEQEVSKHVKQLRQAVKNVLGYSIKEEKENMFRLNSIYCENPDRFFIIQCSQDKDGIRTGVVQTEFTREFMTQFEKYVLGCDSIPAFLAAVNLTLLSQANE